LQFDLNSKIIKNLEWLKFNHPTEIQENVLCYLKSKNDLIIQARTGEGKTLCYGLPIINEILNKYENQNSKSDLSPFALIIVPTRELGVQVKDHLDKIIFDLEENTNKKSNKENSKKRTYFDMKIASILGGFAKEKTIKNTKKVCSRNIDCYSWKIMGNN